MLLLQQLFKQRPQLKIVPCVECLRDGCSVLEEFQEFALDEAHSFGGELGEVVAEGGEGDGTVVPDLLGCVCVCVSE